MLFETRCTGAKTPTVVAGTSIKVSCCGEAFWCLVRHVNNHGHLLVTVDNDLVSLPWSHGSVLVLNLDHVLETANEANLMQFTKILNSLESVSEAACAWREWRIANGESCRDNDVSNTLFLIPKRKKL